ncbi:MAG: LacI family transcriptional regulator [Oscillibacter sp.]|nr:LacI family transcriptional regulator [Oscillibacter sp.]
MKQKKATIRDIAKAADVSISTVSRVINDYKWVNPEVRQRIMDVMQELHYVPNYNAAAMARGRTDTIVILVPNIVNPFFTAFVSIAMRTLRKAGYIPLVYETDNDEEEEKELLMGRIAQLADGIISVTDSVPEEVLSEIIAYYEEQNKPMIFVDRNIDVTFADSLMHDNVGAVAGVVDYFVQAGHSRIAMILGNQGASASADKLEGYRLGLHRSGLTLREDYIRWGNWSRETGERETIALLELPEPPTAIFASNNYICLGVLDALASRGMRPGVDISLIGTEECRQDVLDFEKLGITNLRLNSEELAMQASERIIQKLSNGDLLARSNHTKTAFKMQMTERSSVVCLKDETP